MKITSRHVGIFCLILLLSIGFGFAFDAIGTAVEKHSYPRPASLADAVAKEAKANGLPEAILWATIRSGSDFASNARSEDGRIGLMQLTPAQFDTVRTTVLELPPAEEGLLYDPNTNLSSGAAWLSYLYEHYGVWELTFAAYHTDLKTVDGWLSDPTLVDENGILREIPDKETASYVKSVMRAVTYYNKLYYET
jgi:soluble lytic murein transglycosylase